MNDQQLEDLKQFIDGRISQAEARFDTTIESLDDRVASLEVNLEELRKEMLDGFSGIGEAVDEINRHFDERLTKLENQAI